jgi:hypothetical protein
MKVTLQNQQQNSKTSTSILLLDLCQANSLHCCMTHATAAAAASLAVMDQPHLYASSCRKQPPQLATCNGAPPPNNPVISCSCQLIEPHPCATKDTSSSDVQRSATA